MSVVFSELALPGNETVGQDAVSGTASIHVGYSRPTNELDWWDKGGQVAAFCFDDSAASHLVHHKSRDVGRCKPACTLTVPRLPVVPPCDHVQRDDGVTIDLLFSVFGGDLTIAEAPQLPAVPMPSQPRTRGGCVALSGDQSRIAAAGAQRAAD
jgi:hypothetical protein